MAADGIFLQSGPGLTVLEQRDYDSESLLQEALAKYPEVLAGPTTLGDGEARLLLVRREMRVPRVQDGAGTFSLDHLFLDGDGVPVLVEVKQSSNIQIRREVVGQMLDYAANAVKYWPLSLLRQSLEQTASAVEKQTEELLRDLRPDLEAEGYWKSVEANLKAGRIRMIFVADALPDGLVRIIEFLNEQMSPAEVLGVELRQYVGGGHTVYVPRVVGRTTSAVAQKTDGTGQQRWDRDSFIEAARDRCSPAEMQLIHRLFEDVDTRGGKLSWGKGVTPGVAGWYSVAGRPTAVWVLNASNESPTTRAYMMFYLADVATRLGSQRVERAAQILETIPSLKSKIADARASDWKRYPSLYLADIAGEAARTQVALDAIADLLLDA
jgi:hypothetical protein